MDTEDFIPRTMGQDLVSAGNLRIIGVPDLMPGAYVEITNCLYVSIPEAIFRERTLGETVELHFELTPDDQRLMAQRSARYFARQAKYRNLPDGWDGPLPVEEPTLPAKPSWESDPIVRAFLDRIRPDKD